MASEQILIDSDGLVGWFVETDSHHEKARNIFEQIKARRLQPLVTNLVVTETATLFSRRESQQQAVEFLNFALHLKTIFIDSHLHTKTVELMCQQTRNKTSFVDMANVIVMQDLQIQEIFSFDYMYARDFGLRILGENQ